MSNYGNDFNDLYSIANKAMNDSGENKPVSRARRTFVESEEFENLGNLITESDHYPKQKTAKLRLKKEDDEWCVKVYIDGKLDEDKCYYTDDKADAEKTLDNMKSKFEKQDYLLEGVMDRTAARLKGTGAGMKRAFKNIVAAVVGGDTKSPSAQRELKRISSILESHSNKIKKHSDNLSNDLIKLGIWSEEDGNSEILEEELLEAFNTTIQEFINRK